MPNERANERANDVKLMRQAAEIKTDYISRRERETNDVFNIRDISNQLMLNNTRNPQRKYELINRRTGEIETFYVFNEGTENEEAIIRP